MARLRSLAREYSEGFDGGPADVITQLGSGVSNDEAAVLLAGLVSDGELANQLHAFSSELGDDDGFRNLPGSVEY